MSSADEPEKPPSGKRKLKDLMAKEENSVCADCGAPNPKWISANTGVFICLKCGSAHTILGRHISNVLSVIFDKWSDEEINSVIEVGGNPAANSIYESSIPEGVSKPEPDTKFDERLKFIRSKYEHQEFLKADLKMESGNTAKGPPPQNLPKKAIEVFFSPTNAPDIMGDKLEFIGLMKIRVMRGTNLAVRDMKTSDPYVIFTLGKQRIQTSVANSNLNPIWNETLMFPVPSDYGALKLEVYDQDTLTEDDIMGVAELNLHPLITSATAFGDPEMLENMEIGKWPHGYDNPLIDDAVVRIADGKVKQKMEIELQNVESGEIYLELEWLALDF